MVLRSLYSGEFACCRQKISELHSGILPADCSGSVQAMNNSPPHWAAAKQPSVSVRTSLISTTRWQQNINTKSTALVRSHHDRSRTGLNMQHWELKLWKHLQRFTLLSPSNTCHPHRKLAVVETRWRTRRIKMQHNSSKPSAYKKLFLIFPRGRRRGVCKRSSGDAGWRVAILFKRMNPYRPCSSMTVKQTGLSTPLPPILSEEEAQWSNVTSFHLHRMEATSPLLWLSLSFLFL